MTIRRREDCVSRGVKNRLLGIFIPSFAPRLSWATSQVTNAVVLKAFPEYKSIHDEVHVHITHVPIVDKLRDLREVSG